MAIKIRFQSFAIFWSHKCNLNLKAINFDFAVISWNLTTESSGWLILRVIDLESESVSFAICYRCVYCVYCKIKRRILKPDARGGAHQFLLSGAKSSLGQRYVRYGSAAASCGAWVFWFGRLARRQETRPSAAGGDIEPRNWGVCTLGPPGCTAGNFYPAVIAMSC